MGELIFMVENAPEGGYTARALGASILPKLTISRTCERRFVTQFGVTLRKVRVLSNPTPFRS